MRLTACLTSLALLAGCTQERITVNPPPPPERYLTCATAPASPDITPLEAFALPSGIMAYPKAETDARDSLIARDVVALRQAHFDCANQLGRVRDYVNGAGE